MACANFLSTASRYMPPSRKDHRSQGSRTSIRNHAITIVQSHSFNGHNWAGDLLLSLRSVSIARLHVSLYGIRRQSVFLRYLGSGASPPCCRDLSACLVYQNLNSDCKLDGAGVWIPASGSQSQSFDERSNSRLSFAAYSSDPIAAACSLSTDASGSQNPQHRPDRRHSSLTWPAEGRRLRASLFPKRICNRPT
jgi:hypothetical protein